MLWLLSLISVLVGTIHCDYTCTYIGFKQCYKDAGATFFGKGYTDFCSKKTSVQKCLVDEGNKCQDGRNWYVTGMQDAIEQVCEPGSQLNNYFNDHMECIVDVVDEAEHCSNETVQIMMKVMAVTSPSLKTVLLMQLCTEYEVMHECFYDEINSMCGGGAESVSRLLQEQDHQVTYKICEDKYGISRTAPSTDDLESEHVTLTDIPELDSTIMYASETQRGVTWTRQFRNPTPRTRLGGARLSSGSLLPFSSTVGLLVCGLVVIFWSREVQRF